jgi:hypothetical protein
MIFWILSEGDLIPMARRKRKMPAAFKEQRLKMRQGKMGGKLKKKRKRR